MRGALNFRNCHFAVPAVEMEGEAPAVVQEEESGVWLSGGLSLSIILVF